MSHISSITAYLREHALTLLMWFYVILAPIRPALGTATALIFIDLVTGIWAAKKRGETITSRAMRRTIGKLLTYNFCLVLGFATEQNLLGDALPLVRIVGAWIGATEFKSVLENMKDISGVDIWSALIAKLAGYPQAQTSNSQPPTPPTLPPAA